MPAEDSLVDWTMVEIDFTGYIGRFEGLTDILLEPKGETVDKINDQKQKYGNNINVLISFLQELISLLYNVCIELTYNISSLVFVGSLIFINLLLLNLILLIIGSFNVLFVNVFSLDIVINVSVISGNVNILLLTFIVEILGSINVLLFNV
jgi:hypothetical protein